MPDVTLTSDSPQRTHALGRALASLMQSGDLLALVGELGAGKTQLVRGLADGLNIDPRVVASPTFVLMHEYESSRDGGGLVLVHIDAYRLTGPADLETIGWDPGLAEDEFGRGAVIAVEWADRIAAALGEDRLEIQLTHLDDERTRQLAFTCRGAWQSRRQALQEALT